jgi:hypothetical protein
VKKEEAEKESGTFGCGVVNLVGTLRKRGGRGNNCQKIYIQTKGKRGRSCGVKK